MRKFLAVLFKSVDLHDLHAYGGIAMIGYGLHLFSPPAAWVTVGLIMFWLGARR